MHSAHPLHSVMTQWAAETHAWQAALTAETGLAARSCPVAAGYLNGSSRGCRAQRGRKVCRSRGGGDCSGSVWVLSRRRMTLAESHLRFAAHGSTASTLQHNWQLSTRGCGSAPENAEQEEDMTEFPSVTWCASPQPHKACRLGCMQRSAALQRTPHSRNVRSVVREPPAPRCSSRPLPLPVGAYNIVLLTFAGSRRCRRHRAQAAAWPNEMTRAPRSVS